MGIKKDTVIELEDKGRFFILGRTSFMKKDYFFACQVDESDNLLQDTKRIIYVEHEDELDLGDEDEVDILFDPYFNFVENENLSKMLWEIFAEQ